VKILRDDLRAHQSIVTRFSREAQAAARLDHPNIVQIFSVGAVDRTPYIAMEFVDALPLSAIMQREHRLEWRPALEIARQIAAALACAHDSHVIHRDVKPPNILLDDRHRAFVTDFGIAKILTIDDNLTIDGTRLGTPHYMAPERCKNGEVTTASDLYSLGVLMFQMLTGRLPYEASTPVEMIQRIISGPPARVRKYVPDVPEDVECVVAWLMEMDPKHRPESGHAAGDAIDRVLAGRPLDLNEARTTVAIEHFRKDFAADTDANKPTAMDTGRSMRRLGRVAAVACVVAALLIAAALYWRAPRSAPPSANASNPLAWFSVADVATFSDEGENVTMAELQLQGYSICSMSPAGADGSVAVLLEQQGAGGKRVLCTVSPAAKHAGVRFVTGPAARMELLASVNALGGSLFDGYGLVRAADTLSLVSLRDDASRTLLTAPFDGGAAMAMHPAGAQWVATMPQADGSSSLMAYALEDGRIEQMPVLPGGPRITHVQFSGDGQHLAYLRDAGAGTYSLRVVPAAGATLEPTPLCEGRIALAQNAFNADASAILVSVERDGGRPTVEVVSTVDGHVVAEFGAAMRGAWDMRSSNAILSAPDGKGAMQLWRANPNAPAQREQLTFLDGGTDRSVLVSPDGQWASTFAADTPKPSTVFVRLAQ
jgi:hypothetical protein